MPACSTPTSFSSFAFGANQGVPHLALEYIEGGNLAERIGKGQNGKTGQALPNLEAAKLVETVVRDPLFAQSRYHSSRPEAIQYRAGRRRPQHPAGEVDSEGCRFRLVLQRDGAEPAHTEGVQGTPSYMAPEQADPSQGQPGPHTDVHGLGTILYECLTGRPPFSATTVQEVLTLVKSRPPTKPREISPRVPLDLEAVCLKCLNKHPGERDCSGEALAEDLSRFITGAGPRSPSMEDAARVALGQDPRQDRRCHSDRLECRWCGLESLP